MSLKIINELGKEFYSLTQNSPFVNDKSWCASAWKKDVTDYTIIGHGHTAEGALTDLKSKL